MSRPDALVTAEADSFVDDKLRVVALLASYNRCAQTVACLRSYFGQRCGASVEKGAVLVDDRSQDDTVSSVAAEFPRTRIVTGTGELYWAAAMALAERTAMEDPPDFILWLNDDVELAPGALETLLRTAGPDRDRIVAGAVCDPVDGLLTYSGVRRYGRHPLHTEMVEPGAAPTRVETFNGNVVLIPRSVAERVGPIDGSFAHAFADFDYGMRATKRGIESVVAPGMVGTCPRNLYKPWKEPGLSWRERVNLVLGPKGHHPRSRARYLRRYGGFDWPLFWIIPYVRFLPSFIRSGRRQ